MPCGPDPGSESLSPELMFWMGGEQYQSEEVPSASPSAAAGTLAKLQGLPLGPSHTYTGKPQTVQSERNWTQRSNAVRLQINDT